MATTTSSVTNLLRRHERGEPEAFDRLVDLLYEPLRRLAHGQRLRRGALGSLESHLNTTALVHEAYLKLADPKRSAWRDRGHFLAAAAQAMRHLLVDAARRHLAQKRGGGLRPETLPQDLVFEDQHAAQVLAVHEALESLDDLGERLRTVVECRFFGGLTEEETAEALGVSARTVRRDWLRARGWLRRRLGEGTGGSTVS